MAQVKAFISFYVAQRDEIREELVDQNKNFLFGSKRSSDAHDSGCNVVCKEWEPFAVALNKQTHSWLFEAEVVGKNSKLIVGDVEYTYAQKVIIQNEERFTIKSGALLKAKAFKMTYKRVLPPQQKTKTNKL